MTKGATPALDALRRAGVEHRLHRFDHLGSDEGYGLAAARALGVDPERVFKTLIAVADGSPVVAIVPVSSQLSLRHLAGALGAKRAEMCPVADAERITGYVAGGISPIGQRKVLPTVVDETCELWPTIFVSGGRRGMDVELAAADLIALLGAAVADIAV